jgi:hypothetical protein
VTSPTFELLAMCMAVVGLLAILIFALIGNLRARRNEEQLVDHLRMARGMIAARKAGRLPRASWEDCE